MYKLICYVLLCITLYVHSYSIQTVIIRRNPFVSLGEKILQELSRKISSLPEMLKLTTELGMNDTEVMLQVDKTYPMRQDILRVAVNRVLADWVHAGGRRAGITHAFQALRLFDLAKKLLEGTYRFSILGKIGN